MALGQAAGFLTHQRGRLMRHHPETSAETTGMPGWCLLCGGGGDLHMMLATRAVDGYHDAHGLVRLGPPGAALFSTLST